MIEYIKETLISYKPFLVITAVAFILDFITGIIKAILNRAIQSEKLKKTIPKAIGYISIIIIGLSIQFIFNIEYFTKIIIIFIILIEFISIIENISNYVTIPKFLIKFLEEKKKLIDESEVKKDE